MEIQCLGLTRDDGKLVKDPIEMAASIAPARKLSSLSYRAGIKKVPRNL